MTSVELKEYEQISSRKKDEGNKSWTYVSNLPEKLEEKDIELQEQLENDSNLIIEEFPDGLRVKASSEAGIAQFSDFSISVKPRFVSPEKLAGLFEFAEVFDEDMELSDNEVQLRVIFSMLPKTQSVVREHKRVSRAYE